MHRKHQQPQKKRSRETEQKAKSIVLERQSMLEVRLAKRSCFTVNIFFNQV